MIHLQRAQTQIWSHGTRGRIFTDMLCIGANTNNSMLVSNRWLIISSFKQYQTCKGGRNGLSLTLRSFYGISSFQRAVQKTDSFLYFYYFILFLRSREVIWWEIILSGKQSVLVIRHFSSL